MVHLIICACIKYRSLIAISVYIHTFLYETFAFAISFLFSDQTEPSSEIKMDTNPTYAVIHSQTNNAYDFVGKPRVVEEMSPTHIYATIS